MCLSTHIHRYIDMIASSLDQDPTCWVLLVCLLTECLRAPIWGLLSDLKTEKLEWFFSRACVLVVIPVGIIITSGRESHASDRVVEWCLYLFVSHVYVCMYVCMYILLHLGVYVDFMMASTFHLACAYVCMYVHLSSFGRICRFYDGIYVRIASHIDCQHAIRTHAYETTLTLTHSHT